MSVFSEMPESSWIIKNDLAFAVWDKYPASKGHALVIPRREVADWDELDEHELRDCFKLLAILRTMIASKWMPSGYQVMVNVGSTQHEPHVHFHLIPHYGP
jgi:diadenosine tetraphosphate (Ap4A) HIT family hydrolase